MNMGFIGVCVFGLILVYFLIWVFIKPFKKLVKILIQSVAGAACIWGINSLLGGVGICMGLNIISALVCGVLGIPGFLMMGIGSFLL